MLLNHCANTGKNEESRFTNAFGTQTFVVSEGPSCGGHKAFWMQKYFTVSKILGISYKEEDQQLRDLDPDGLL